MGLRSRIKGLVFGAPPPEPVRAPVRESAPPTPSPAAAAAPSAAAPPAPSAAAAPTSAPKGKDDPEVRAKYAKVVAKAKLGVLKHVLEKSPEGRMSMSDMHDFSERRFFIAHRSFSDLMETWIGEGLVTYDPETGSVVVTDAGRTFVNEGGVAQNRK